MQYSMWLFPVGTISCVNIMYAVVDGVKGSSKGVTQCGVVSRWLLLL